MTKEDYIIRKKTLALLLIAGALVITSILFFAHPVSADTPVNSYCCEKTNAGQWCQNVNDPSLCATGNGLNAPVPTSCESTSFCRLGTCVNSQEGTCLPNVPGQVCQSSNGVWVDGQTGNIPQCQLGCCLFSDQAAFVTQTRCSFLSAQQGVNGTFRTDITDEQTCIASANPQVEGACVLDTGLSKTCRRLTRGDCQQLQQTSSGNTTVEFHEGLLCSATTLATNCGMTKNTECVPGKDQVYFVDSCGNQANVYDTSKVNDPSYWTSIQEPSSSCNFGSSNANSASCGNCDYISGSVCKAYQRGSQQTPTAPTNGNFVCADLSCHYNGQVYQQGASWCISNTQAGVNKNLPGSEDAVQKCFDGEVTTELCDPFRNKICIQQTSNGNFPVAGCVVNNWQECSSIDNIQDCLDPQRDCQWVNLTSAVDSSGNALTVSSNGTLIQGEGKSAACVPKYPPGFEFWNTTDNTNVVNPEAICAQASQNCNVKFTRNTVLGAIGAADWTCDGNCPCIGLKKGDKIPGGVQGVSQWVSQRMGMCVSLGDCGNTTNYFGKPGYPTTAVTISKA